MTNTNNAFMRKVHLTEMKEVTLRLVWEKNPALRNEVIKINGENIKLEYREVVNMMKDSVVVDDIGDDVIVEKNWSNQTIIEYTLDMMDEMGYGNIGNFDEDDAEAAKALVDILNNGANIVEGVILDAIERTADIIVNELGDHLNELLEMESDLISYPRLYHILIPKIYKEGDEPFILVDRDGKSDYVLYGKIK